MKAVKSTDSITVIKFRTIFRASVWVVVSDSVQKSIDYIEDHIPFSVAREEDKKYIKAYTFAFENDQNCKRYILFFSTNVTPGTIAHEVKHLINILYKWHGQKLSLENDEVECHLLEELVDKVYMIIVNHRKHA
jgi:hypothetical protein